MYPYTIMTPSNASRLDDFRLSEEEVSALGRLPRRRTRHRRSERFLRGPVPWAWLTAAGRLPGSALQVGVTLWQLAGMKDRGTVVFCLSRMRDMGVKEAAARRGLRALKVAGLVSTCHRQGRGVEVTLLEIPAEG
jgi:hypothetical protein